MVFSRVETIKSLYFNKEVQPNVEHEWLLSSKDVAEGYGLSVSGVQKVKDRYLEELEEGKYWVLGQNVSKLGGRPTTMWTKEGD